MSGEFIPGEGVLFAIPDDAIIQRRLTEAGGVLGKWLITPPGSDPHISNYAQAVLPALVAEGPMLDMTTELLHARPDMGASHLETLKLRAIQKQLIVVMGDEYPDKLKTPHDWTRAIQSIYADPQLREELFYDMRNRDLQTNEPNRGDNMKVFLSIANYLGRLMSGNIVEVGCSQNLIIKRHARQQQQGWASVMQHYGHNDTDTPLPHVILPGSSEADPSYTEAYQYLRRDPVPFESGVGIDRIDPTTSRDWTYYSVYPSQYADKARMRDVRELLDTEYTNVDFHLADFNAMDTGEFFAKHPELRNNIDLMFFCTCCYQSPENIRESMFAKAAGMAKFVGVQDSCMRREVNGNNLVFPDDWQTLEWGYQMYVLDTEAKHPGWEQIFMSPDTRADKVRIGTGKINDHYDTPVAVWDVIDDVARNI